MVNTGPAKLRSARMGNRARCFGTVLGAAVALAACGDAGTPSSIRDPSPPNILLIVADDMGLSDIGAFGSEITTPNLDALARAGVLFTQFHVAPNCGPTRGSLLTGLDFHRAGMGGNPEVAAENQKSLPAYQGHLRDDVVSVAELLRDAGPARGLVPLALPDLTEMDLSASAKNAARTPYAPSG